MPGDRRVVRPDSAKVSTSGKLGLAAGDGIVAGTPGGVGAKRTPPVWMKAGDVVEVEVDAIGVLRNDIRAESD